MKHLLIICLASGILFSSCHEDDSFDISTIDSNEVDTTYVDPFFSSPSTVIVEYLDQSRIDTVSLYGIYCLDNPEVKFGLSNRFNYLPSQSTSEFVEDSSFIAMHWENDLLVDSTIRDLTFHSHLLINNQLLILGSNENSGVCDYKVILREDDNDNLNTSGIIEVDVYNQEDGSLYSEVRLTFELEDLTRVLCN